MKAEIMAVKKLENGKLAVRWKGKRNFNVIDDPEIAAYLVYMIVRKDDFTPDPNQIRLAD